MTDNEYNMQFGEWCNSTQNEHLSLGQFGEILYTDSRRDEAIRLYHDLWEAERKEYRLRIKNQKITNALESLKKQGIECELSSYQNGHIKAKTKHGRILSYYATTETIAGYFGTKVKGLDEFIRICKE